jgi:hypothetical protein
MAAEAGGADVRGFSLISAVGRIAIGLGMLAAPEAALRALGFSEVNAATIAIARVAGVRDLVLGGLTLAALDDPGRLRAATIGNATADAGDSLAFAMAIRADQQTAGIRGVATALPATLAGLWVAWRLS